MSTDRGRRRTVSKNTGRASKSRPGKVRLAPDVRLDGGEKKQEVPVLVCPTGRVQLNAGAAAILRLCDGSLNREEIVAEIVRQSHGRALAADVADFLSVARARGWVVET